MGRVPSGTRPNYFPVVDETPLLAASDIAKHFGSVVALRSAELTVAPGEIHALLGANGAGKSTLVKILSGVHSPDSGSIAVNGTVHHLPTPALAQQAGLATVFQDPALVPDLSVAENFRLTDVETDQVAPWLGRVGVPRLDLDSTIRDLPLPTLRLLDLARALSRDPQLLLLDEITAALPADQAERVFSVMQEWRDRGRSVLFITHRLGEVLRMCDIATVLRDGRNVARFDPAEVGEDGLVDAMLGTARPEAVSIAEARSNDGPVVLKVSDLGSKEQVRGVNIELRAGEVLGIAALEGQGQERLFELLSGDRRPDRGTIEINGRPLDAHSPYDAVREGLVLVPSDRLQALLPQRSIRENLGTPLYRRVATWFRLAPDEPDRVDNAIERMSIDTRARQAGRLSGGNQQKVVVGRWLAAGFRVLLCFDPTRGIDVGTKHQIYGLLRELAASGAAVLVFTSELAEIPLVCDRVLVLYGGQIVSEQLGPTATEESILTAAHGLGREGAA